MFTAFGQWFEHRCWIRRRWQADARVLVAADEVDAHYVAHRCAARARVAPGRYFSKGPRFGRGRRSVPQAAMDIDVVRAIEAEEECRS